MAKKKKHKNDVKTDLPIIMDYGIVGEVPQEGSSQRRKRNAGKGTKVSGSRIV